MKTIDRVVLGMLVAASLTTMGCAYNSSSPDVYSASQAQRESSVRFGTLLSVRSVRISTNNGQPSGLGAVGGGALGAVAGSAIGGGKGSIATAIIGGIAGAVAGNAIENGVAMQSGVELDVQLDNREIRSITQADNGDIFRPGDRVRLLYSGGVTRVTH